MADIQYLNYGDLKIELLALLNNLANKVQGYVQKQPWSNKRKKKFMSAYSDLMNKGILGASNKSGQWSISVNGNVDLDSMSKKDKEMYQEAAYFIQQQMAGLPTKANEEEKKEEDKSKLPIFDNFQNHFSNYLSKKYFGGSNFNIGGENDEWNYRDERDSKGVRGTTKRAALLATWLKEYSDQLEEGKYNFEGSPFENLADLKTRIGNAVTALNNGTFDLGDRDALNSIGLKTSDWFNNGSGDPYTNGNYSGTYGDYYGRYLPEQLKLKQQQIQAAIDLKKLNPHYTMTTRVKTGNLPTKLLLADKYGSTEGLLNQIILYGNKGFNNLTLEESKELVAAFRYGANSAISDEEFNILKNSPSLRGAAKSRFKKFGNIGNMVLDTATGQVISIYDLQTKDARESDFLAGQDSKSQLQQYLQNTEFTNADWAELGGIVGDIVSILDPEPISAAIAGVGAAGARNYARTRGPESWGLLDYLSQGADYLTGAIGAIPGVGDALLAGKVAKNVVPWLRRAMRVPAFIDLWNSTPELAPIGKKLFNGEDLTVLDWMNLGTFFRGLATTRNLNVQNRASRKALQERGYNVSNRIDKRLGITSSKPITESGNPTVRMTINGKQEEIPISASTKTELDKLLAKAGNDIEARSKIIRENAEVQTAAERAGVKVKEKVTDANGNVTEKISDNWNNSKVVYNESLRNARLFNNRLGLTPSWARTSGGTFGETSNSLGRNFDNFENYLNSNRGLWDKIKYGSNQTLRGMDKFNTFLYDSKPNPTIGGILYSGNVTEKDLLTLNNVFNPSLKKLRGSSRVINPKNSTSEVVLVDGSKGLVQFGKNTSSGNDEMFLIVNGNSHKVPGNSLNEMKLNLGKMLSDINSKIQQSSRSVLDTKSDNWKNFVKSIKDLKRKGYLFKQGGKITDENIDNFLKQYK